MKNYGLVAKASTGEPRDLKIKLFDPRPWISLVWYLGG